MAIVVPIQPQIDRHMLVGSVHGHRDWNDGICSCFNDCSSLITTISCLTCAICSISSRAGECMCMPWFVPGGLIALRARIRTLGGIRGSIFGDCLTMTVCGLCGVCQMQRELNAMGL